MALAPACGRSELDGGSFEPDALAGEGGSGGAAAGGGGQPMAGRGGEPAVGGGGAGAAGVGGGGAGAAGVGGEAVAGSGGAGMAGAGGLAPVQCGDGVLGPGEACEPGSEPALPAFELRQGATRVAVEPIVGPASAAAHFDYRSRSSHTGFEAAETSVLYLYRWSPESAVTVVLLNGIDEDSTGIVQPLSDIVFDIEGLPDTAVLFSDDDVEFARTTPTTAHAEWDCVRNTDGGMIQGLSFPGTWHLTITPSLRAGISQWIFLSGQGSDLEVGAELSLDLTLPVELVASDHTTACRGNCTVPRCGDAVLDPGEVCDDGNDRAGDGCVGCRPE